MTKTEAQKRIEAEQRKSLEYAMLTLIRQVDLPAPTVEYKFHPDRKWRFDGAYSWLMLAYEVDGGTYSGGAHVRGVGVENDNEKRNEARVAGWWVFQFTRKMIESGMAIDQWERAVNARTKRVGPT